MISNNVNRTAVNIEGANDLSSLYNKLGIEGSKAQGQLKGGTTWTGTKVVKVKIDRELGTDGSNISFHYNESIPLKEIYKKFEELIVLKRDEVINERLSLQQSFRAKKINHETYKQKLGVINQKLGSDIEYSKKLQSTLKKVDDEATKSLNGKKSATKFMGSLQRKFGLKNDVLVSLTLLQNGSEQKTTEDAKSDAIADAIQFLKDFPES